MTRTDLDEQGWRLRPLGRGKDAEALPVPPGGLTLGRSRECDVVLAEADWPQVSQLHARVALTDGRPVVTDLDSTNGTFVNDARVARQVLEHGAVLQLGPDGPRYVAVLGGGLGGTTFVPRPPAVAAPGGAPGASLGQTAMVNLRQALGLPVEGGVDALVARRARRNLGIVVAVLVMLGAGAAWGLAKLAGRNAEQAARIEQQSERIAEQEQRIVDQRAELEAALESRAADAVARFAEQAAQHESDRRDWEELKAQLAAERETLEERIAKIVEEGSASTVELSLLRGELDTTRERLAAFDPLELEQSRLAEVRRVRKSVVLIEAVVSFRERDTGNLVHVVEHGSGAREVNLEGKGEPLTEESSGSGFLVGPDGYVLTNAHVVWPPESRQPMPLGDGNALDPEVALFVTFSGQTERLRAELVASADEGDEDYAVVKIEPFEGMTYLPSIDLEQRAPEPGSEVFLYGFPLGTFAVQEGERVIASTFKGILSRRVGPYLQVDAGVHPGISGGPMTDSAGRVLGLVTSVQAMPGGDIAAVIGYVLPVSGLASVWPPPKE